MPLAAADMPPTLQAAAPFLMRQFPAYARYPFYLETPRTPGQLARWEPRKKRIYLSKKAYKKWLRAHPAATAQQLAQCVAPLWVHEFSHAQDAAFAQAHGFVWPVTLQDEVLATAKQLLFMRAQTVKNQQDYALCRGLLPVLEREQTALAQGDWRAFEAAVLGRYSRLSRRQMPPPPLTAVFIFQAQGGQMVYGPLRYKTYPRGGRAQHVFYGGTSWTQLNAKELVKIPFLAPFPVYQNYLNEKTAATQKEFLGR